MVLDPNALAEWERILRSPVAVLLVLLAGLMAISGALLAAVRTLWVRNQELEAGWREYLLERDELGDAIRHAKQLLTLSGRRKPANPNRTRSDESA